MRISYEAIVIVAAFAAFALANVACGKIEAKDLIQSSQPNSPNRFRGGVQAAFNLEVDGESYPDIEAYYSAAVKALPSKVQAAGYKDYDRVEFKAKIGFADLIQDMIVYVQTSGNNQGRTTIDGQGNFAIDLPAETNAMYKVRANKRVEVRLYKADKVVNRLCYNFSAIDQQTMNNPVILDKFTSSNTLYDCDIAKAPGIEIPDAPVTAPSSPAVPAQAADALQFTISDVSANDIAVGDFKADGGFEWEVVNHRILNAKAIAGKGKSFDFSDLNRKYSPNDEAWTSPKIVDFMVKDSKLIAIATNGLGTYGWAVEISKDTGMIVRKVFLDLDIAMCNANGLIEGNASFVCNNEKLIVIK